MTSSDQNPRNKGKVFDYLRVDEFMKTLIDTRALGTAFETGFIDYLNKTQHSNLNDLKMRFEWDHQGLYLLINMLKANEVILEQDGEIKLSNKFKKALRYIDLLRAKLELADLVVHDFTDLFTTLVKSEHQFGRNARVFDLFGYNRCFDYTPENYALTKRWVRITTSFTRYEAPVCMEYYDFAGHNRVLDIGGNSGEFALQMCRRYPQISATVFDLPLVCDMGKEHIRSEPEAGKITFVKGNALKDELPKGFDLITFKSMLHDWPEREAEQLIVNAAKVLEPGGTMLVFERGPFELGGGAIPYSIVPFLLFFRSFRSPMIYENQLKELGFHHMKIRKIYLEMPFFLLTATKGIQEN
jgi:ubiquinone/menaquinone biosynthesis C-methylase UbiE